MWRSNVHRGPHPARRVPSLCLVLAGMAPGCTVGSDESSSFTSVTVGMTVAPETGSDGSGTGSDGETGTTGGSSRGDGLDETGIEPPACSAPDVLILLDRTGTMYTRPDNTIPVSVDESCWAIAVTAIEQVVQALDGDGTPLDQTVRFGLQLFPQLHPECTTVQEIIAGINPTNPQCQGPEVLVSPAIGSGASIAAQIDVAAGELCESTPVREAFQGAATELSALASADHEQFILFVTDGADLNNFCDPQTPEGFPGSILDLQALQAQGVGTFILGVGTGFTGGTGNVHETLNDYACAGGTAPDPELNCEPGGMGMMAVDGLPQALYFTAADTAGLVAQLVETTEQVCCGCVPVG